MAFLGFIICAIIFGKSRIRLVRLISCLALILLLSGLCSFLINKIFAGSVVQSKSLLDFNLDSKYKNINVKFNDTATAPVDNNYNALAMIKKWGDSGWL